MALEFPPNFPFHRTPDASPAEPAAWPRAAGETAPVAETAEATDTPESFDLPPERVMTATAARPVAQERRRSPRQTLVAKASVRPDDAVPVASMRLAGFVSNISMHGVGFHTRKPMEIGGKYHITLELGPMKWSSRLRVVSCRRHEESETFDIGAEFIGNELNRVRSAA